MFIRAPGRQALVMGLVLASMGCRDPLARLHRADGGPGPVCIAGAGATITCVRDVAWQCDASANPTSSEDCAARGLTCAERLGCRTCIPDRVRCDGETIQVCSPDGMGWETRETCDAAAGLRCSAEGCANLCERAEAERSYLGCEYWPVSTRNSSLGAEFSFAIAVANPELVPAVVVVDRGGNEIERRTIAAGGLELITLPWIETLVARDPTGTAPLASIRMPSGAYHVTSDVPVVVTQFNPLEYKLDQDCADEPLQRQGDGVCNSFTNDASLLLPAHVLTGNYVAVSRPTFDVTIDGMRGASSPGFVAIVGTSETPVDVQIVASAHIAASADGSIPAIAQGESQTLSITRGEVIELVSAQTPADCPGTRRRETLGENELEYCDPGQAYDLTGTILRATGPIAVITGHNCTFVPFDKWACDHLEEQLFPVETLGRSAIVAATHALRGEPNLLRIVSAGADNTVTLTPAIAAPFVLGVGEWREFEIEQSVTVQGSAPLLATLFLVGQDFAGLGTSPRAASGDPSMAFVVPDAQYRRSYAFLAPATYAQTWIDVIAPTGLRVVIDNDVIRDFREIEGTAWSISSTQIDPGVHQIDGALPFGLMVYGFGSYTSYMVSGGLDLEMIAPPI